MILKYLTKSVLFTVVSKYSIETKKVISVYDNLNSEENVSLDSDFNDEE